MRAVKSQIQKFSSKIYKSLSNRIVAVLIFILHFLFLFYTIIDNWLYKEKDIK